MSKTVLIILAAVVVLIVIVVLTGMRYLRADDADDLDDQPADRGRARGGADLPAERRHGGDGPPDGPERSRSEDDRRRREDDSRTSRDGRPARVSQPNRPARRDHDDVDEPVSAGVRSGRAPDARGGQRGSRDYDDRSGRQVISPRDYEAREGRDGRPSGSVREQDVRDDREKPRRDDRDNAGRDDRDEAARDDRDKRSSTRPNARPDDRRSSSGQVRRQEPLPEVRSRQGRGKRGDDGEWPSTEWDELSDVDYWAELASDKPLTTTAQPAASAARTERQESRRAAESASGRGGRSGGGSRRDTGSKLPVRTPRQLPQSDQAAAAEAGSRSGEFESAAIRRLNEPAGEPTLAMLASRGPLPGQDRQPMPGEDDPLTSPSFPRIAADDSRSYRRGRPETPSQGTQLPDSSAYGQQLDGYPAAAPGQQTGGFDAVDQRGLTSPGGYPRPASVEPAFAAAGPDPYRSVPRGNSGSHEYPAAAPSATGYAASPASYAASPTGYAASPTGYAASPTDYAASPTGYPAAPSPTGYPAPATPRGFPDAPAYRATASHPAAVSYQDGPAYQDAAAYPAAASYPAAAGYPAAASTNSYPTPSSATSVYATPSAGGGFPASAPVGSAPGEPPLGYPGYGASGPGPASYLPPLDGSYQQAASSRGHAPVPIDQPVGGYPGFADGSAGPVPAGSTGIYSAPLPQLPEAPGNTGRGMSYPAGATYPSAPSYAAGQYQAAPDEPPAYPSVPEAAGYAGADPYAVDPYGYPGNGNGGF